MKKEDFYTGEPVKDSPPITEIEAVQNAGFGQYDYDPASRMASMSQPQMINPGGYGYNTGFMNPPVNQNNAQPVGFVGSPYQQYGSYYNNNTYNPYMQQNYGFNQYGFNNPYYQQPVPQDMTYFVPGFNFYNDNDLLASKDLLEKVEYLTREYWTEQQRAIGKSESNNSSYSFGYNFYGSPYYNPYTCTTDRMREILSEIESIKEEAKNRRSNLNLNLSKLAHSYLKDNVDQEELNKCYNGYTVTIPGNEVASYYQYNKLDNLRPYDDTAAYQEFHKAVSTQYNRYIPENASLKQFFENSADLAMEEALEEEKHRRKNGSLLYNSAGDTYKYFVRAKVAERNKMKDNGGYVPGFNNMPSFGQYPTLNQSAKLCDDGTLNITCNVGSKKGQQYTVVNEMEAGYEESREKFMRRQQYLNSINQSLYGAPQENNTTFTFKNVNDKG